MSDRAFFAVRREAELPAFRKVLAALPKERFDYTPHERSPSAAAIAWVRRTGAPAPATGRRSCTARNRSSCERAAGK